MRKTSWILFACLILAGALTPSSYALAAPYSASDVLGQRNEDDDALFTSANPDNSPNPQGFESPAQTALDTTNHRLFVADTSNNRVVVFDLDSNNGLIDHTADYVLGQSDLKSNTSTVSSPAQNRMNLPYGVAYDETNNRLFVADGLGNRVLVFDTSSLVSGMNASYVLGQSGFTTRTAATTQSGMTLPQGLTYDAANQRLFVVDRTNNRVLIHDAATSTIANGQSASYVLGQASFTVKVSTTTQSGMSAPASVSYDPLAKRLFVADLGNHRVLIHDVATSTIANNQSASYVLGQANFTVKAAATTQAGMNFPEGVLYDATNTRLFVADTSNHRVLVHDVATSTIANNQNASYVLGQSLFTTGTATGSNQPTSQSKLDSPNGLAYDASANHLFVTDNDAHRIMIFDVSPGTIVNGMNAEDEIGQLEQDEVFFTSKVGSSFANNAPNEEGLSGPQGIALDIAHHRLFVADANNSRVLVYNLDTSNDLIDHAADYVLGGSNFKMYFTGPTQASISTSVADLEYDAVHDRLFVADSNLTTPRVLVFDTSSLSNGMNASYVLGQANFTASEATTTQNGMQSPIGLAYDAAGNRLFVGDQRTTANRVLVFHLDDIGNGMNASYVLGQPDFTTGTFNLSQSGMRSPDFLDYDATNERLFVADAASYNRITVFDVDTSTIANGMDASYVIGQEDFTSQVCDTTSSTLCQPDTITYDDANSRLFVQDADNGRILLFDVAPSTIANGMVASAVVGQADFESANSGTSQTLMDLSNGTNGMTYDPDNNRLYASDTANNRVLIFDFARITNSPDSARSDDGEYGHAFSATNEQGGLAYAVVSGSLPPGLSLSSAGVISGTLTESSAGSWNFNVELTDTVSGIGAFTNEHAFSIEIAAAPVQIGGGGGGSRRVQSITDTSSSTDVSILSLQQEIVVLRARLQELVQQRAGVPTTPIPYVAPLFIRDLTTGSRGDDVESLQRFLNTRGYLMATSGPGSPGEETEYFGSLTKTALAKFQTANNIFPAIGYFGPVTRAAITALSN